MEVYSRGFSFEVLLCWNIFMVGTPIIQKDFSNVIQGGWASSAIIESIVQKRL